MQISHAADMLLSHQVVTLPGEAMRHTRRAARPPRALECRLAAEALGRNLKRELARLDCGIASGMDIKPVFDRVYVPAGVSIADSLAPLRIPELGMLRLPLCPELAATQIRILLRLLAGVAKILDRR